MRFFSQQKTITPVLPDVRHVEVEENEDALQISYQPQHHPLFFYSYCGLGLVCMSYISWCGWFIVWYMQSLFFLVVVSLSMSLYIIFFITCELLSLGTQWKVYINSEVVELEWRCGKISGYLLSRFRIKTTKTVKFERKVIVEIAGKNSVGLVIYNLITLKQFREPWFVTMMTYAVFSGHFRMTNGKRHYLPVIIAPFDKPQNFSRWLIHKINCYLDAHQTV